jgi:Tol biopolymer transport system component
VGFGNLTGSFSVSRSGVIAWRSTGGGRRQLLWFNRAGQNLGGFGAADDGSLLFPELSPDGKRAAISRGATGASDIWVQEGTRLTRLTFDPAADRYVVWSPDSTRMVFASNRKGAYDLFEKPANASAGEQILLQSPDNKWPSSWSPDGKFILILQ